MLSWFSLICIAWRVCKHGRHFPQLVLQKRSFTSLLKSIWKPQHNNTHFNIKNIQHTTCTCHEPPRTNFSYSECLHQFKHSLQICDFQEKGISLLISWLESTCFSKLKQQLLSRHSEQECLNSKMTPNCMECSPTLVSIVSLQRKVFWHSSAGLLAVGQRVDYIFNFHCTAHVVMIPVPITFHL
jgi:hypothetical protein